MKKLLSVWLLAIVAMLVAAPQADASATSLLAEILEDFNMRHPGQHIGLQAAFTTIEGCGGEPLLLLSSMDNSAIEVYDFNASAPGRIKHVSVGREAVEAVDGGNFFAFPYVYRDLMDVDDNTMRYNPLPVDLNLEKNRFHVVPYGNVAPYADNPRSYDRMIFKPHVNAVSYVSMSGSGAKPIFRLNDPAKVKTMFRGYSNPEAVALVVPHEFLNTHTVLQFSRWKSPEPIKKLDANATSAVNDYYRGWRIADSRWLATCAPGRTFYAVTFEPRDEKALAAVVCVAEGAVASAIDIVGEVEDGKGVWYGDYNYFEHQPEIMAVMATPEGLELFVRYDSMETTHYTIWREVQDQWVFLCDYTQYWFDEDN